MKRTISFILNGDGMEVEVEDQWSLLYLLRERLDLTGTKEGCGGGECGACTVIVGGEAINSCLFPATEIDGKEILTIEGLASPDGTLHPLQKSFIEKGAIQCGFCTPGMILAAKALLDENPHPSDDEIKEALAGNLCRCTGYIQIIEAIRSASRYAEPSIHVVPWQTEEK
jgi:carbon-monoxide dehydrogenase small subunit